VRNGKQLQENKIKSVCREKTLLCFSVVLPSVLLGKPDVTEPGPLPLYFSAGEVRCDLPNNKLDKFSGTLTYKGKRYFLDHDKLLLRGCIIRNTDWCYGLVIYTGTFPCSDSQNLHLFVAILG
jgi:hypothetical protein